MGFLNRLFGGGGKEAPAPAREAVEHNGFLIYPEPIRQGGQFPTDLLGPPPGGSAVQRHVLVAQAPPRKRVLLAQDHPRSGTPCGERRRQSRSPAHHRAARLSASRR